MYIRSLLVFSYFLVCDSGTVRTPIMKNDFGGEDKDTKNMVILFLITTITEIKIFHSNVDFGHFL